MKKIFAVLLLLIPVFASCSETQRTIKPSAEGKPYETLGVIEVTQPAKHPIMTRILTLGLLKYRSFDRVKGSLDAQLVRKAKTHYKAQSVINVTYWPEPNLARSTDVYHARGEMIRYEPFAKESVSALAPAH